MTTKNVIASVDHSILSSSTWEIFHTIFNLVAMPQLNHRVDFWEQAIAILPRSYTYFLEALCSWSKDSSSIYHVRPSHRIEYCLIPFLNRSVGTHIGLHWVGNRFYWDTYWISISYCTGLAIGSMGTHTGSVFHIALGWQQVYGDTHWISISYCTGLAIGLWGHALDQYFKLHWVGNRSMGGHTGSVFHIALGWQ